LRRRRNGDGLARAEHLFQIHFQPDHEQQQNQADAGDGLDGFWLGDEFKAVRSDGEARHQIGHQQRLPEHLARHGDHPGRYNANDDVNCQSVVHERRDCQSTRGASSRIDVFDR